MDWSTVMRGMGCNTLRTALPLLLFMIICFVCGSNLTNVTRTETRTTCTDRPCYLPQQCTEEPEQNATCTCGVHFTGDRCDVINLKHIPDWNITTDDITFTWKVPIIVENYRGALYRKYVDDPAKTIKYYDISNGTYTNLTFGDLKFATTYVVCVVRAEEIERLWNKSTFTVTLNKDRACCFSFITSYNGRSPETIAAIVMGITVGSITGMLLLVGVIRICIINTKSKGEKYAEKSASQPPSRTSSKRGSKRSPRPRSGSVKKTAWKYEGTSRTSTPGASREELHSTEMGSCASVASVAPSISVTLRDESGQALEVDLGQVDADDQAVPT